MDGQEGHAPTGRVFAIILVLIDPALVQKLEVAIEQIPDVLVQEARVQNCDVVKVFELHQ